MASKRLYVGNIPYTSDENEIRDFFGDYTVEQVKIITDKDTGRPRGFCFVELATAEEAAEAIKKLDRQAMGGRAVVVNEAEDKPKRNGGNGHRRDDRR